MGDSKQTSVTQQSQTQTRTPAPLTSQQIAINDMASKSLTDYEKLITDYFKGPQYAQTQQVGNLANQRLIGRLDGSAPLLSPQEEAYLNQAFASPMQQGQSALKTAAQQAAQMRGMTIADSPIGGEYMAKLADYMANVNSQRANAGLNLGQQNYQQYSNASQLAESIRQAVTQQQMALAQQSGNLQNQYEQQRLALAPVHTSSTSTQRGTTTMPWSQGFANIGQGISGLSSGLMGSTDKYGNTSGGLLNLIPGGPTGIQNAIGAGGEFLWNDVIKGMAGGGKGATQVSGPGAPGLGNALLQQKPVAYRAPITSPWGIA